MAKTIEKSLLDLDFATLTRRTFTRSPAASRLRSAECLRLVTQRLIVPITKGGMVMFQTLLHPTDFDERSKEAFRVARSLAQALGARLVVFHVVRPPAVVTQDGRVICPATVALAQRAFGDGLLKSLRRLLLHILD